ncbi:MAG: lysozyme inhibitor LprI family protein [Clostridium fessum]
MELYLLREARPPGQVQARTGQRKITGTGWARSRIRFKTMENSGSANTTDAMREAVAYEYRLWDAELNQIYQAIMAVLPDEETDTLRGRERRWIRERGYGGETGGGALQGRHDGKCRVHGVAGKFDAGSGV